MKKKQPQVLLKDSKVGAFVLANAFGYGKVLAKSQNNISILFWDENRKRFSLNEFTLGSKILEIIVEPDGIGYSRTGEKIQIKNLFSSERLNNYPVINNIEASPTFKTGSVIPKESLNTKKWKSAYLEEYKLETELETVYGDKGHVFLTSFDRKKKEKQRKELKKQMKVYGSKVSKEQFEDFIASLVCYEWNEWEYNQENE